MIISLIFTNGLNTPVLLCSNQASDQPLVAHQSVQVMFELQPGEDNIARLALSVQPDT